MNRHQKIALFQLIVAISTVLLTALVIVVLKVSFNWQIARGGLGLLGLLGLMGIPQLIFKKEAPFPDLDERDRIILSKSALHSFQIFWLFFVAACILPVFYGKFDFNAPIPTWYVYVILIGGFIVVSFSRALLVLLLYKSNRID